MVAAERKSLIVLAGHEPSLDPRIDWIAQTASRHYNVHVYGLAQRSGIDYSLLPYQVFRGTPSYLLGTALFDLFKFVIKRMGFFAVFAILIVPILGAAIAVVSALLTSVIWIVAKTFPQRGWNYLRSYYRKFPQLMHLLLLAAVLRQFLITFFTLYSNVKNSKVFAQVIHANDLDTLLAAAVLKSETQARLIYDNHEYYPVQFLGTPKWFHKIFNLLEGFLLKSVDEVSIVSPQLGKIMEDQYALSKDVSIIPNCAPIVPNFEVAAKAKDRKLIFLLQGQFANGRGIGLLIEHWSKLDLGSVELHLRGPDSQIKDQFIAQAEKTGALNRTIFFPTPVPESELIKSASLADVGVIPYEAYSLNNKYCCPNKLSQYMQAGLAILTNQLPFVESVVRENACGDVFDIYSFESFSAVVRGMVDNREKLIEMQRRARQGALTSFNWDVQGQRFLEMYAGSRSQISNKCV